MDDSTPVGTVTDARTLDEAAIDAHAEQVRTEGWTVVENAIAPELVDELNEDLLRLEKVPRDRPRRQPLRGHSRPPGSTTSWSTDRLYETGPRPSERPAHRGEGARSRPPHLVAFLHRHRTRRVGSADSRRRSGHQPSETTSTHHLQHHVGPHRLHRGERGHPAVPGDPYGRSLPQSPGALRLDPGRDGQGKRARLGGQPVARGRGQPDRATPGRAGHELLRRLSSASRRTSNSASRPRRSSTFPGACRSWWATRSTTDSSVTSTSSTRESFCSAPTRTPSCSGTTPRSRHRPDTPDARRRTGPGHLGPDDFLEAAGGIEPPYGALQAPA